MAQERLNVAASTDLLDQYKWALAHVEGTTRAEKATLASVLQLADDERRVAAYVEEMVATIDQISQAHLAALQTHMEAVAAKLHCDPVRIRLTDLERSAARMVPQPTARVKEKGYGGWRSFLQEVSPEARQQYPYGDRVASTGEVNLLINGTNSVLDINKMLDAQNRTMSDLQAIINYIEILKLAGLVEGM
jgi:hypothetical protein